MNLRIQANALTKRTRDRALRCVVCRFTISVLREFGKRTACRIAALKCKLGDIRVRGEIPERDIAVHALVMGDGLDHACRVRVQTPARTNLTDAACMPDLTVEDYGGEEVCEDRRPESCC